MKPFTFLFSLFFLIHVSQAQQNEGPVDTSWKKVYRATSTKINDLIHTKLDVRFDFDKSYMYGKEWVSLKPHFYPTDSLILDAKGMEIKEISVVHGAKKKPLRYSYDGLQARIQLDKTYNRFETYTLYIDYVSKPDEFKSTGSAAITDAKGLYFINPKGLVKDKPTQIWTQGETEANSVWFLTIDKPNQKSTEEIIMTVPSKYVTLSNGILVSKKNNADGTRTDDWRMDLKHAPYLFFMGVGDYSIIKDSYKGKEVNYYVEKEYAPVARKIFGETPAMIGFYEKITGVQFPWPKYDQIVGRDYVSGAMENTTATLHQESAYQNARQLTEGNKWEDVISHELFHQWFGDLVTAESWSNITVNESMADYSETLWNEFRHGKDAADEHIQENRATYLANPADAEKNLVRFYYGDKEDVFDNVSYPKGGSVLHMLRNYVGDSAFFKSLNRYLEDNKFKSAEAQNLRLAFEEVTGQDLNWFWNEWYYSNGHPKLNITYNYSNGKSMVMVEQQQTGKNFRLPIAIDIYANGRKERHHVWVENGMDTFTFNTPTKPDLINFDGDKVLLAQKTDNKSAENFVYQFHHAGNFLDRMEALSYFSSKNMKEIAEGLNDPYHSVRFYTLQKMFGVNNSFVNGEVLSKIENLAANDPDKLVKAQAVRILGNQKNNKYVSLFTRLSSDSSYTVAGNALDALSTLDGPAAFALSKKYSNDSKGNLGAVIAKIRMANATESDFDFLLKQYKESPSNQEKIQSTITFGDYLSKIKDPVKVKAGVDEILSFRNLIPVQFRNFTDPAFKQTFDKISKAMNGNGNKQLADYIDGLLK